MEQIVTNAPPDGRWRYAALQTDEDGDVILWMSHSSYTYEPFWSAQEAHDFAEPWMDNYEIVRTWVPKEQWEIVPESEWSRS